MTQILQDLAQQKVSGAYRYIIRELKQWRWWCQREGLKSDRFRLAKQQLCTCITYISLPSLHNYNMELFNFMFCGTYTPHANGCNIVGQQLPTLLDVTCCVHLHTLLHVVACCCMLLCRVWNQSNFSANNSQHFFCSVIATHAHYAWITKTYGLYPSRDALQVPNLLQVVASVCTPLPTRTQQLPTLLAQQCWELLCPFARQP